MNKLKVLLVRPYQPSQSLIVAPSLGLLYLASALRKEFGADVELLVVDQSQKRQRPAQLLPTLQSFEPDVVAITALNHDAEAAHSLANVVKNYRLSILVALGGPYVHRLAPSILDDMAIDWACDGPGERVFPQALRRWIDSGRRKDGIGTDLAGMAYRTATGLHLPIGTDLSSDLDSIAFPAWDLMDFDVYADDPRSYAVTKAKRYAYLLTSRGCPYKCGYCHDIFGKKFLYRSVENVLEEIEILVEKHGVGEIKIVDDIFNLHRPRLQAIMRECARRWNGKIKFAFPNGLRGDIFDEATMDALRDGGAYAMAIAIETVTERLQTLIGKDLNLDKAKASIAGLSDRGMLVTGFFMLGFPTETLQEMEATVEFARSSRLMFGNFYQVVPQEQTPLYELAVKENSIATLRARDCGEYYSDSSWYERAYGFPLQDYIRKAHMRFYTSPQRLIRLGSNMRMTELRRGFKQLSRIVQGVGEAYPVT